MEGDLVAIKASLMSLALLVFQDLDQAFVVELGHWDERTTKKIVNDRLWSPKVHEDALDYLKSCDYCKRMKPGRATARTSIVR